MDKTGDEERSMMMGLLLPIGSLAGDNSTEVVEAENNTYDGRGQKRSMDDAIGAAVVTSSTGKTYTSTDESSHMACGSERKRHREKRRRGQVNAGFDDLKALLVRIDPGMQSKVEINRVDLISRTVAVIKDMNEENERIKKQVVVQEHHHHGGSTAAAGGVLTDEITYAMMPFLVPGHQHDPDGMVHYNHHQQPATHTMEQPPHHNMTPPHSMPPHTMPPQHYFGSSFRS